MCQIDETDIAILEMLKSDGRCSYSEIAGRMLLSRTAVKKRIRNMEENGIIKGYTVILDAKAYRKLAGVFLDIETDPGKISFVAKRLTELPDVAVVAQHTGVCGLHVHAYIDSLDSLSSFLDEHIYTIDGVKSVQSQLLVRQYKTNPYLARYQE